MDIIDQLKLLEAGKVAVFPRDQTIVAARETIERLRAALQWIADQVDNEDGDLDDIILCANKALAHEQSAPGEREYDPNIMPCDDAEFGMKP